MATTTPQPTQQRQPCSLPTPTSTKSFWHTQPSPLLLGHRSTRHLPTIVDVVVIGSGMTGASIAHHLLAASSSSSSSSDDDTNANPSTKTTKPSVLMLEAREACWGATGRNGGHCQPFFFTHPSDPSIGRFELSNYHALQTLITHASIPCEFIPQPGCVGIFSPAQLARLRSAVDTVRANAPELGALVRVVTAEEDGGKEELAALRVPDACGAVVTSTAARLWPYKFVAWVLEDLVKRVGDGDEGSTGEFNLQTLTPVEGLEREEKEGRWKVRTARGEVSARKVVLATNGYTSHLLPGFADLIVPCRGQMSALEPLVRVAGHNRLRTNLGFWGEGLDDYLIQRPNEGGGHLMFGGGRQHGPCLGVTDDSVVDERTAAYLRSRLVTALGLPEKEGKDRVEDKKEEESSPTEFTASNEWTGIMGFSRDGHPFIGPVPDHEDLFMAAGFTGHGMPNTWLSGKAAAIMVRRSLEKKEGRGRDDAEEGVEAAVQATGLPRAYVLSEERVRRAMRCGDVETDEWVRMHRG